MITCKYVALRSAVKQLRLKFTFIRLRDILTTEEKNTQSNIQTLKNEPHLVCLHVQYSNFESDKPTTNIMKFLPKKEEKKNKKMRCRS